MTSIQDRIDLLDRMHSHERDIMLAKASDYSGKGDCNKNIKACEVLGLCSAEVGVLIRLGDKMQRLHSLVGHEGTPKVVNENIMDTIMDARNYLCILAHLLQEKE